MKKTLFAFRILFVSAWLAQIFLAPVVSPSFAQSAVGTVVITSLEANQNFPEIQLQALVLDAGGNFIPNLSANQFTITEDGVSVPVVEVASRSLPVSARTVFVIDELSIASRVGVVREAIQSFAQNQMRTGDSVEVLAAGENGVTKVIVPFASDPNQVVSRMQEANYRPASASSTDLMKTVSQALENLSKLNKNVEGDNKVVVFSVSVLNQVKVAEIIEEAKELSAPVHTVLLGSIDVGGALSRLARGTGAGDVISPDGIKGLFKQFDQRGNQTQYLIRYRSRAAEAGDHELVLKINGKESRVVTFQIEALSPPEVRVIEPAAGTAIVRSETFFNPSPESAQPTEQTVAAEVTWPDGHPREIIQENTVLVINGKSLGPAITIRDNGKDTVVLEFTWDLSGEQTPGVSNISIVVEAEDELGLKGKSAPQAVTLEYVELGDASGICPPLIADNLPALCSNWNLVIPLLSLLVALAALVLVIVYLRRNPKVQERVKERLTTMMTRIGGAERATRIVTEADAAKASLILLEGNPGRGLAHIPLNSTTTLGRSGEHAQVVLQGDKEGSPISRLHCTILEKDGLFEIRDESSANGTHLNDVRLPQGKAHPLKNGDVIELARARDGGVKFKFEKVEKAGLNKTRIVADTPTQMEVAGVQPEGYTPTLPPASKEPEGYTPTLPPSTKKDE